MVKRIFVILPNGFDPDLRTYKEAKYLVSKGYDVTLLCWDRENKYIAKPEEVIDDIKIKRFFPKCVYGTGFQQVGSLLKFIWQCKIYFKGIKGRYYCHCVDLEGMITGFMCCYGRKSRLVFDMREFYETGVWAKIKHTSKFLVRFFQSRCYKVIYLNDLQKSIVKQNNLKKLVFLPNYPEKSKFYNTNKIKSDKIRVAYIGYVRHERQLMGLMKSVQGLDGIEVYIHGSGVLYKRILAVSKGYKNCYVTGEYNHDDVADLYRNADLVYCVYDIKDVNDKNAYPTKFFEGIITKTPLLVAEGSVVAQFCEKHKIGFAVNVDYHNSLKRIFAVMSKNPDILKKMADNENKMAEEYLWESVVRNLDEIYQ